MAEIDFVVLKVNGADINQLPEQKLVQMFLTAGEPLLVEIHRKYSSNESCFTDSNYGKQDFDNIKSKSDFLEITPNAETKKGVPVKNSSSNTSFKIKLVVATNQSESTKNLENCLDRVCKTTQTDTSYFLYDSSKKAVDHFVEHEHNLLDQCMAPEIDVEEITLRKSDSNERLGLIVCYNSSASNGNSGEHNGAFSSSDDNDACTEVYISGIQPDSVAGRDGRLRQGDQILQINGKDIKNKEETELLIAENNNAVTLLISRYLFAEEFNEPLLADIEIDEEDDAEDEEYYVENNMTYENCFPQNAATPDLEKALVSHHGNKSKKQQSTLIEQRPSLTTVPSTAVTILADPSNFKQRDVETANSPEKNPMFGCEKIIEQLPSPALQQNIKKDHHNLSKRSLRPSKVDQLIFRTPTSNDQRDSNYDTAEHIYETIPEDSELEPVYCSPYESSTYVTALGSCSSAATDSLQQLQQKKNLVKWLDVCSTPMTGSENAIKESGRSTSSCIRKYWNSDTNKNNNTVSSTFTTITNGSSSSGGSANSGVGNRIDFLQDEELDHSSSAYNTGGSNNGTVQLFSALNPNGKRYGVREDCKTQNFQQPKAKTNHALTTIGSDSITQLTQTMSSNLGGSTDFRETLLLNATLEEQPIFSPNHQCNNESYQTFNKSVCREAISQHQHYHLSQSLTRDKILHLQSSCCPQFVAPNLSQYHFVSSQEVRTGSQLVTTVPLLTNTYVNQNPHSKDEAMVWKVKRRQDGTRYIVRRPARNRCMVQNRSIRINTEHIRNRDISTTAEEDNMSEVKTGRYWPKEDRKKHVERGRERKQQNQCQLSRAVLVSKVCVKDQISSKPLHQKKNALNQQYRTNQHRVIEHEANSIQQSYATATLQQHYQLQFNSSRIQKPLKMIGGCGSNETNGLSSTGYNKMQFISTKESVLETTEKELGRITLAPLSESIITMNKLNGDGQCRPIALPSPQGVNLTNTSVFPTSAEDNELKNFISRTSV
ncbi:slo-interacting protein 1 [Bactrocera neohumeralis]|uniref:slo-interacting protein 1 n=1 Tax=Bactrocera neohumeralis TaxID=98809 RepID=UPI00216503A1|nr:slo-interacting protein 1 [Bactrocera neohumeralis]XP_050339904.1 slo-interacting protein 1 [Bactrocera neohumeralis]XP_050339906.1 slo-interacting protein 1 [Bactrocera neohumeralis]